MSQKGDNSGKKKKKQSEVTKMEISKEISASQGTGKKSKKKYE